MTNTEKATLHAMLSPQALRRRGIKTYKKIGKEARKSMKAYGCTTTRELFDLYIHQNPLSEEEWLDILFRAADIVDERIEAGITKITFGYLEAA